MSTMDEATRQEFLAGVHVGVMGIADGERGPLTVPVWYGYEPGGVVTVLTGPASRKAKLLEATGRFSLCAQQEELPYKYVMAEGPVVETRAATHDETLEMAVRYLGEELGKGYADNSTGESIIVSMQPERWYSVDYGS